MGKGKKQSHEDILRNGSTLREFDKLNASNSASTTNSSFDQEFYKVYSTDKFEDDDEVKKRITEYIKFTNQYDLIDFGHCVKESLTLKMKIRDFSSQSVSYEKSIDSFESISKKYINLMKPVNALKLKCITQIKETLTSQKDRQVTDVLNLFNFESLNQNTVEETFFVTHLQRVVEFHKEVFKILKKTYSEYEKSSIVFDSNVQRKNVISPYSKAASKGQDSEVNLAAKSFFLSQLEMAFIMNKLKIQQEFISSILALELCDMLNEKAILIEVLTENKKYLSAKKNKYNEISDNLDFIYCLYKKCIEDSDFNENMMSIPEGYLERKKSNEKVFSKKSWYFIENNSMIEFNKKNSQNTIIIKDINKTFFRPPEDKTDLLTFECLEGRNLTQFRCSTENEVKMWLNGVQIIQTSTKDSGPTYDTGSSKDMLESLKSQVGNNRKSLMSYMNLNLNNEKILKVPGNKKCADCLEMKSEWFSLNLGVCFCIICSGKHRGLSTRISKVRSLGMDEIDSLTETMLSQLGNDQCNVIYEYQIQFKGEKVDRKEGSFFKDKYELKKYLPKNKNEWKDCAEKYIEIVKQNQKLDKETEEIELFKKVMNDESFDDNTFLKFHSATFIYFLSKKEIFKELQNIGDVINRSFKLKIGAPLALLFYNDIPIDYVDEHKNNIAHLAAKNEFNEMLEFIKGNYIVKMTDINAEGKTPSSIGQ